MRALALVFALVLLESVAEAEVFDYQSYKNKQPEASVSLGLISPGYTIVSRNFRCTLQIHCTPGAFGDVVLVDPKTGEVVVMKLVPSHPSPGAKHK